MSKYVIKNCPAIYSDEYCKENTYEDGSIHCQDRTDCVMKKIVEKCREADGKVVGYTKGKVYDGKNLIDANLPLTTINPLAKEILDLLDIEECE